MRYFISPKVMYGRGALKRLADEVRGKGNKAVIITGKTTGKFSDQIESILKDAGYETLVWKGSEPDPSFEVIRKGGDVLRHFQPQWIIGLGGGSAIDCAKGAWLLYERPDLADTDLSISVLPKTKLNLRQKSRFIAIPTTSGTGTDATWATVLTDRGKGRKIPLANNDFVPDISILDPELTVGMSKQLTASTGMDVIGHVLDAYTARQQNDFSDGLSLQALRLVFEWLPVVYKDGSNLTAREKMQNAATIAGLAFGNSNTALSHCLAHPLGTVFGMHHGRAVGIAVPYSLEYISSNPPLADIPNPVMKLGIAARFVGIDSKSDPEAAQRLIQKVRHLSRDIGEPLSLKEAGITEKQMDKEIDSLVHLADLDPSKLSTPCQCNAENFRQLFQDIWEGKGVS